MKVKLKADERIYRGSDGQRSISVNPGDTVEVSEAKAAQLLRDFPKAWEIVDGPEEPVSAADPGPDAAPGPEITIDTNHKGTLTPEYAPALSHMMPEGAYSPDGPVPISEPEAAKPEPVKKKKTEDATRGKVAKAKRGKK